VAPLAEVFESVIARHAPRAQGSEVAWAVWGAIAWDVQLSTDAARLIDAMEDDIVALLAMHANVKKLFPAGALTGSKWTALMAQPDALTGEHWLLAYEGNQQGWLTAPTVAKDAAFASLSGAKVSFYDRTKGKPAFPKAGRAVPGGTLAADYA
jgi:hypothetical protein